MLDGESRFPLQEEAAVLGDYIQVVVRKGYRSLDLGE